MDWDGEGRRGEDGLAHELFHKYNVDEGRTRYSEDEFSDLYREVNDDLDVQDPEEAWRQWNAGSGRESEAFYEAEERSMSVGDVVEIVKINQERNITDDLPRPDCDT